MLWSNQNGTGCGTLSAHYDSHRGPFSLRMRTNLILEMNHLDHDTVK